MKVVISRGVGFPDYTDMIYRAAISTYAKNQGLWFYTGKVSDIYGQIQYYVNIPIEEGRRIYLSLAEVSMSVGYLVDLVVRITKSDGSYEEYVTSGYGSATFRPEVPILIIGGENTLTLFFNHWGPMTTTAYTSLNVYGVWE